MAAVRDGLRAAAADRGGPADAVAGALLSLAAGLDHHAALPSTQPLAAASSRPWTVVSTDHQTAGRGRLGRGWENPPGSGLAMSVVLPLDDGAEAVGQALAASRAPQRGQVPLCVGAAVHEALAGLGLRTGVKWPNDVLSRTTGRKLCGILCQVGDGGRTVVAGIGLNVWEPAGDLGEVADRYASVEGELAAVAREGAGAAGAGADTPAAAPPADLRERVMVAVLHRLAVWHAAWLATGWQQEGDGRSGPTLVDRLSAVSLTVGERVRLHLPGGDEVRGTAEGLAESGGLLVRGEGPGAPSAQEYGAADVVHLRRMT
ncbi:biotin--[acetyl-CoA-carboxylase] ligase [Kytococcus sp. Marseille-QA3725]